VVARPTVLVVEDDAAVRDLVDFHLARSGFDVVQAEDATAAFELVHDCDVVVLDWMLPSLSGIQWLRRLRAGPHGAKPVLMLTARASEIDRVEGLESGADDYLVKPFSAAELVARVRALLRRLRPQCCLVVGALAVDLEGALASVGGVRIELTRREFELLAYLAAHPHRVFTRSELLDRVWGEDFVGTERTVDQHVAQLRARIGSARIETVRGRGYRLVDPGEP
jgi:two-component system, OmpR family, response regulator RegX3